MSNFFRAELRIKKSCDYGDSALISREEQIVTVSYHGEAGPICGSGVAHHVTQRGNGRQQTFFTDSDYAVYRDVLAEHCGAHITAALGRNPRPAKRGPKPKVE